MFDALVVGPGGDGLRVVAVVAGATDANGALDDAADNTGVGRGRLAGLNRFVHGAVTSIR
ncbi:hypothetical protein D3C85_1725450 [compost metagenome]